MDKFKKSPKNQPQATVEVAAAPEPPPEKFSLSEKFFRFKRRPKCCAKFFKVQFVVLACLTILKAIAVIVVSIVTAVATKVYDQSQSGRPVANILIAVTAAVTIAICIYAIIAVYAMKNRPIHVASIVLIILAVIQSIIAGTSVRVTDEDQTHLAVALKESFRLAQEHNPRNVKMWAATQHGLSCCGLYGPEDYRPSNVPSYFAPDVPISCCPAYDADRSDLVQEREREACKARKNYYEVGCKYLVTNMYTESATTALSVLIGLIILEVLLSISGSILSKKQLDPSGRGSKDDKEARRK